MTPRQRDGWLLIAGLPGVAAPFVPFISWPFGSDLTLAEVVTWRSELTLVILPAFVPMFAVTWQLHRVITDRESVAWRAVAWFAAAVAMIAAVLGDLVSAPVSTMRDTFTLDAASYFGPLYGAIAANLGLLLWLRRRGRSPDVIAETFLLGTYVATAAPWIVLVVLEQGDRIGPWLVAWTCLAYLATIVIRVRASNRRDLPITESQHASRTGMAA